MTLKHEKIYENRLGEIVAVRKADYYPNYPFVDKLGRAYSENGKLYIGKESDYDLIKEASYT